MISDVKIIEEPLMSMKVFPTKLDPHTLQGVCKLELELNIVQAREWLDACGMEGLIKRIGTNVLTAILMQSNK